MCYYVHEVRVCSLHRAATTSQTIVARPVASQDCVMSLKICLHVFLFCFVLCLKTTNESNSLMFFLTKVHTYVKYLTYLICYGQLSQFALQYLLTIHLNTHTVARSHHRVYFFCSCSSFSRFHAVKPYLMPQSICSLVWSQPSPVDPAFASRASPPLQSWPSPVDPAVI